MRKLKYIALMIFMANFLFCQIDPDTIKKKAIDCSDLQFPNQKLYSFIKNFKCICLGEMHGTKEPAELLTYLAKLITSNNKKVIIGIEISRSLMSSFIEQPDSLGLSKTLFFSTPSSDGRASEAWFKTINECHKLKAKFCFFSDGEDKLMFDHIVECYKADTNYVILTLSGNVHNMLLPWKENKTMGCYLKEYFGNSILSVNHVYNEGTMYNYSSSEGLKISQIPPYNSVFSIATNYSSYLIPLKPFQKYSACYYTKYITASLSFKK